MEDDELGCSDVSPEPSDVVVSEKGILRCVVVQFGK
jgi:hypothetical protein